MNFNHLTSLNDSLKLVNNFKHPVTSLAEQNFASKFAEEILIKIREFDNKLDSSQEVGMRLVSFGQTVTFAVHGIGYINPSLIIFYGTTEDGLEIELMQHVSQISFLLMAAKRKQPAKPKRTIGFICSDINK